MFGNRKLKNRIHELEDDNDTLRENTKVVRAEIDQLRYKLNEAYTKENKIIQENNELNKSVEALKTKLRAQNEADLMFVSVKIIAELLKGKKVSDEESNLTKQQKLANAYSQMQSQQGQSMFNISDIMRSVGL